MATTPRRANAPTAPAAVKPWTAEASAVRPMLAALEEAPLRDDRLAYEPKYDGIRALVDVEPGRGVRITSRLGNDKTRQFPEIARALTTFARRLKAGVLLDGEIVALDDAGEPTGFQALQGRIHVTGVIPPARPVAFIAFDVLRDGRADVRALPLVARRARLERIFGNAGSALLRLSTFVPGDGRPLYRDAVAHGWEGIVAKHLDSPYQSGRRSPAWRKLKLLRRQECVIGGFTEPRRSRAFFGSLLLGVYGDDGLEYVGHVGTGFDQKELARLAAILEPLETPDCPFRVRPRANARPHWVKPELVAEIKFADWTADGVMRAPAYLGLRDDVRPETVRREDDVHWHAPSLRGIDIQDAAPGPSDRAEPRDASGPPLSRSLLALRQRLEELEARRVDGTVSLPGGGQLAVTNLAKVFWKGPGLTKGDLLRYYVTMSSVILPAIADRPLVMKRFPNGIAGKAFYQQRAPGEVPRGVRVEVLPTDTEVPSRLIGGSLATLLYMAQMAVVSQDPWFSRVGALDFADHVALDLDPMPGVPFARVLDVARWIHDELERLGVPGFPKTSGAEGLHVYLPLPPATTYETGRLFCELVATVIAQRHPRVATVERAVDARGRTVYIDYLQNIRGKTLATAYSARASTWAGVSTPLTWGEVHEGVEREAFTMRTMPSRVRTAGDLWAGLRKSRGANLHAALARGRRSLTRGGSGLRRRVRT
jgi:bifunctional non-homologous end joining protein LigD